jgi:hypothetical protein
MIFIDQDADKAQIRSFAGTGTIRFGNFADYVYLEWILCRPIINKNHFIHKSLQKKRKI